MSKLFTELEEGAVKVLRLGANIITRVDKYLELFAYQALHFIYKKDSN